MVIWLRLQSKKAKRLQVGEIRVVLIGSSQNGKIAEEGVDKQRFDWRELAAKLTNDEAWRLVFLYIDLLAEFNSMSGLFFFF